MSKKPWNLLFEYEEIVCRGCVNYEGVERTKSIIRSVKESIARAMVTRLGTVLGTQITTGIAPRIRQPNTSGQSFPNSMAQRPRSQPRLINFNMLLPRIVAVMATR